MDGAGLLVSQRRAGVTQYYAYDLSYNVEVLTDAAGVLTDFYQLDAFGNELAGSTGSSTNPFVFGGALGYFSEASGLVYVRNRFYIPELGRWLSPDPIGFAGGDINLYRYVRNDPIGWTDVMGLNPLDARTLPPKTLMDSSAAFLAPVRRRQRLPHYHLDFPVGIFPSSVAHLQIEV